MASVRSSWFRCRTTPSSPTLIECDRALASIGRRIKVLKAIDWPLELEERFLSAWRSGQPELPAPDTQPQVLAAEMDALGALMRADRSWPSRRQLAVQDGVELSASPRGCWLGSARPSSPVARRCCTAGPTSRYRSQDVTNVDGALEMLAITDELVDHRLLPPVPFDIPAEAFAADAARAHRPHVPRRRRSRWCSTRRWPPRPPPAASASRCARRRCSPNATSSSSPSTKHSSTR